VCSSARRNARHGPTAAHSSAASTSKSSLPRWSQKAGARSQRLGKRPAPPGRGHGARARRCRVDRCRYRQAATQARARSPRPRRRCARAWAPAPARPPAHDRLRPRFCIPGRAAAMPPTAAFHARGNSRRASWYGQRAAAFAGGADGDRRQKRKLGSTPERRRRARAPLVRGRLENREPRHTPVASSPPSPLLPLHCRLTRTEPRSRTSSRLAAFSQSNFAIHSRSVVVPSSPNPSRPRYEPPA
jgi:hypothetical protein